MQALLLRAKEEPLAYSSCPDPEPGPEDVVVHLRAAALNHRDLFILEGRYPGIRFPLILGSDGAGLLNGREVLVNPSLDWGPDPRAQARSFHILGLPRPGTFAEQVAVPASKIYDKPAHLSWEQAAALPLAGLTAYRALFTRGRLLPGERVLISGVGGGVALLALQFALAAGAEVWVSSGKEEKIERARALGAAGGVNYRHDDWPDQAARAAGGFDLVIDGAGGPGFASFLKICNPGGRIVSYGGTLGPIPQLSPQVLFWKQLSLLGSTMGTDEEFGQMLDFVSLHRLYPVVDEIFPLEHGQEALDRMARGDQFGKIVLRIS